MDRLFRDCSAEKLPEEIGRLSKCGTADKRHLHVLEIINRNQKADSSNTAEAWRGEGARVETGELTVHGATWKTVLARGFASGQSEQMTATLAIEPQGVRSIICGDPSARRCSEVVQRAIADGLTPVEPPVPAEPRSLPQALAGCATRQLHVAGTPTFMAECPAGLVASVTQVETSSAFKGVASRLRETQIAELRAAGKPFTELSMNGGTSKALRKKSHRGVWTLETHVEDTPYRMRTITCEERAALAGGNPETVPGERASPSAAERCIAVIEALLDAPPPYVGVPVVGR